MPEAYFAVEIHFAEKSPSRTSGSCSRKRAFAVTVILRFAFPVTSGANFTSKNQLHEISPELPFFWILCFFFRLADMKGVYDLTHPGYPDNESSTCFGWPTATCLNILQRAAHGIPRELAIGPVLGGHHRLVRPRWAFPCLIPEDKRNIVAVISHRVWGRSFACHCSLVSNGCQSPPYLYR